MPSSVSPAVPDARPVIPVELTSYLDQTMSQIPTVFGRLAYVAALWNPEALAYRHHLLDAVAASATVNAVLADLHLQTFGQWLSFNLRQQRGDLVRFLDMSDGGYEFLKNWYRHGLLERIWPAKATFHEKQLFSADFALVMQVLENEFAD